MLHVRELQKARTMRVRSAESAARRRKFLCTVNYEEIVNYGELYLLTLARNRELPYSNFCRKEIGSNEAEGKSPLQTATTANVARLSPADNSSSLCFTERRQLSSSGCRLEKKGPGIPLPRVLFLLLAGRATPSARCDASIVTHGSATSAVIATRLLDVAPSVPRTVSRID